MLLLAQTRTKHPLVTTHLMHKNSTYLTMKESPLLLLTPLCFLLCSCPSPEPPSPDPQQKEPVVNVPQTQRDDKLISFKGIKAKVPQSTSTEQTMKDDGYELLSMTMDQYLVKFAQLHQNPETGKDYQSVSDNFKALKYPALDALPVRTLNGVNTVAEYKRFQGTAIGVIKHQGNAILRFTFTGKSDPKSQAELDAQNAYFEKTMKPILQSTTY